jgi:hypothetical protein
MPFGTPCVLGVWGKFGIEGAISTKDNKPLFEVKTFGLIAVAFALLLAGLLVAWKAWFPSFGPEWISSACVWFLAALFSLRAIGDVAPGVGIVVTVGIRRRGERPFGAIRTSQGKRGLGSAGFE